jgi:hypothetical protein
VGTNVENLQAEKVFKKTAGATTADPRADAAAWETLERKDSRLKITQTYIKLYISGVRC